MSTSPSTSPAPIMAGEPPRPRPAWASLSSRRYSERPSRASARDGNYAGSPVTLQQLRYFLATCRHGSFTAAADTLFIAQPSVAEQIRRLEHEVGVRLFVRT